MIVRSAAPATSFFVSPRLLRAAKLPSHLRKLADGPHTTAAPIVVAFASELIVTHKPAPLHFRRDSSTRYLVIIDVPEPAVMRLPAILDLRRPEQRLHVTRDVGALRRLLVASLRGDPRLGIVDAYLLGDELVVLCGDLESRSFPLTRLPGVASLPPADRNALKIDGDGSYLYWAAGDLHLGVSQLLQSADPAFLTDVYIERHTRDATGRALRAMREERQLRQIDIPGLSERQVRRIEEGISRLRVASAECFARAFGIPLNDLLEEAARRAPLLRSTS